MLYNFIFIFLAFLMDGVLNTLFPAQFAFESMYFVPCIGLCSLVITVRKMEVKEAIILVLLFGLGYDFFYGNTIFFYTIVFLLVFVISMIWAKVVNESILESVVLCISTVFTKEFMVYLFMRITSQTTIGFNTFATNRLFLTILVNTLLVSLLVVAGYIKDDLQKRKEVRIRREERLPWLH